MCNILDPVTAETVVPVCYIFSVCNEGKRNACTDDLQWLNSQSIVKNGSLLKNVWVECNVLCSRKDRINIVEASGLVLWDNTHIVIPKSLTHCYI